MKVFFKASFIKDFKKLPFAVRREVRFICTDIFSKLLNMRDYLGDIRPLHGHPDYYRIRVGDYRIGFKKAKDGGIEFMRVRHRKDIYRHFPL